MPNTSVRINDEFKEIDILSIDSRNRITIGKHIGNFKRLKVFQDARGEILLVPVVEIPSTEVWLHENKKALKSVQRGIKQAKEGRITKKDLSKL